MKKLSARRQAIVAYITDYVASHNGERPTYRRIAADLGYSSASATHHAIRDMERAGIGIPGTAARNETDHETRTIIDCVRIISARPRAEQVRIARYLEQRFLDAPTPWPPSEV